MPPRFWWLKRLSAAFAIFILAIVPLKIVAGRMLQRKLDSAIAAMRGAETPLLFQRFAGVYADGEDIPPARLEWEISSEDSNVIAMRPLSPSDLHLADGIISKNKRIFDLARRAREKHGHEWRLVHLYGLEDLFVSAAARAHQLGNDAAAIDYLRDALAIARAGDGQHLHSHFETCDLAATAATAAIRVAPAINATTVPQARALLNDLLDDQAAREGFLLTMREERRSWLELIQQVADGTTTLKQTFKLNAGSTDYLDYCPRSAILKEALALLPYCEDVIDAARAPDYPASLAKASPAPPAPGSPTSWPGNPPHWRQPIASLRVPPWAALSTRHFNALYARRAAAIVLALRLYELDHGRKPARTEDLVPNYLPQLLDDPVAGGGAKLLLPAPTTQAGK